MDLTVDLPDVRVLHFAYNSTVTISMKITHNDNNADEIVRTLTNLAVDFSLIDPGDGWKNKKFSSSWGYLEIEYRITSCDPHFTGNGCDFCDTQWKGKGCDECSTGYYGDRCSVLCR